MVGQNEDDEFVQVCEEGCEDLMELPIERNGTVLLSTVQAQFPNAIGLKYKSSSGGWRGIRSENNVMDPPSSGWGETVYYITKSDVSKRKPNIDDDETAEYSKKSLPLTQDIVVFGLPFSTTDDELKEHFTSSCGELAYHEIKMDRETKKSRGFAFIRFTSEEAQNLALDTPHEIEGRRLTVRLSKKKENPIKLFVGRLRSGTTRDDVLTYFQEFGELTDVFVPDPFRGFGFVTYESDKDGLRVSRMHHVLKGANLNVTVANPLEENNARKSRYEESYRSERDRSRDRSDDRNGYSSYDRRSSSHRESSRYSSRRSDDSHSRKDTQEDLKKLLVKLLDKQ